VPGARLLLAGWGVCGGRWTLVWTVRHLLESTDLGGVGSEEEDLFRGRDPWLGVIEWDDDPGVDVGQGPEGGVDALAGEVLVVAGLLQDVDEHLGVAETGGDTAVQCGVGVLGLVVSDELLAKAIGVPQTRISAITRGKRRISADTGLRLSRYFSMSDGFWTGLQADYERELAKDQLGDALDAIHPIAS